MWMLRTIVGDIASPCALATFASGLPPDVGFVVARSGAVVGGIIGDLGTPWSFELDDSSCHRVFLGEHNSVVLCESGTFECELARLIEAGGVLCHLLGLRRGGSGSSHLGSGSSSGLDIP